MIERSPVFRGMFESGMVEQSSRRVDVKDFGQSVVEAFVQYLYTAHVGEEFETLVELLKIGNKYLVDTLMDDCAKKLTQMLSKNKARALSLGAMAEVLSCEELLESCAKFVAKNEEVLSHGWEKEMKDSPMFLMKIIDCMKSGSTREANVNRLQRPLGTKRTFSANRSATPELNKPNVSGLINRGGQGTGIKLLASKNLPAGIGAGSTAKKIFISQDGKIIGHQMAGGAPPGKVAIPSLVNKGAPAVSPGPGTQQKVQIVKSADGKIQVRGLLPGQQLVQMPDGKLQIFSSQQTSTASPIKPGQGAKIIGGNSVIQSPQSSTQPVKLLPAQQPSLLPKPAAGVLTSPSKTYCILRNPNVAAINNTPIQP